jgi:hypothetical protein
LNGKSKGGGEADELAGLEASRVRRERNAAGRVVATGVSQLLMGSVETVDGGIEEHEGVNAEKLKTES